MLGVGSFVERTKLKLAVDGACSTQDEPIQSEEGLGPPGRPPSGPRSA